MGFSSLEITRSVKLSSFNCKLIQTAAECCPWAHVCLLQSIIYFDLIWIEFSIILTGWAMSEHAQALMLSTKVDRLSTHDSRGSFSIYLTGSCNFRSHFNVGGVHAYHRNMFLCAKVLA